MLHLTVASAALKNRAKSTEKPLDLNEARSSWSFQQTSQHRRKRASVRLRLSCARSSVGMNLKNQAAALQNIPRPQENDPLLTRALLFREKEGVRFSSYDERKAKCFGRSLQQALVLTRWRKYCQPSPVFGRGETALEESHSAYAEVDSPC